MAVPEPSTVHDWQSGEPAGQFSLFPNVIDNFDWAQGSRNETEGYERDETGFHHAVSVWPLPNDDIERDSSSTSCKKLSCNDSEIHGCLFSIQNNLGDVQPLPRYFQSYTLILIGLNYHQLQVWQQQFHMHFHASQNSCLRGKNTLWQCGWESEIVSESGLDAGIHW